MIVRTLRSLIPKQSLALLCSSSIKLNTQNFCKFFPQNVYTSNMIRSYNFSTSNNQQHNEEIESILGELESESLENFEEPFVNHF